jgi:hypothetical protein
MFLASLLFNELYFKHKPLGLALTIYPVQFSWYMVRIYGYLLMMGRILLGLEPAIRASKRAWYAERQRLREAKRRQGEEWRINLKTAVTRTSRLESEELKIPGG